jgi:hypothetical protein
MVMRRQRITLNVVLISAANPVKGETDAIATASHI